MNVTTAIQALRLGTLLSATLVLGACSLPWESYPPVGDRKQAEAAQREIAEQQVQAQRSGEQWYRAREAFREKLIDVRANPSARPQDLAVLVYEYGRTSGVLCDWDSAESSLKEAYALDQSYDGPTHMSLIELARLHLAQQQYGEARGYFEKAIPELETVNANQRDPVGYIEIIEEYSAVLSTLGEATLAQEWREQATQARESIAAPSTGAEITPYGAYCLQAN